jgi:hypothetical protein
MMMWKVADPDPETRDEQEETWSGAVEWKSWQKKCGVKKAHLVETEAEIAQQETLSGYWRVDLDGSMM